MQKEMSDLIWKINIGLDVLIDDENIEGLRKIAEEIEKEMKKCTKFL